MISAQETLEILTCVEYLQEFETAIGRSGSVRHIAFDDKGNEYWSFRYGRDYWEQQYVLSRSDLIRTMNVGTKMVGYGFFHNQPMNPTSSQIFIFVDEHDRILAWMYSNKLVGHEREAMPAW
jgi:hypothetical protein